MHTPQNQGANHGALKKIEELKEKIREMAPTENLQPLMEKIDQANLSEDDVSGILARLDGVPKSVLLGLLPTLLPAEDTVGHDPIEEIQGDLTEKTETSLEPEQDLSSLTPLQRFDARLQNLFDGLEEEDLDAHLLKIHSLPLEDERLDEYIALIDGQDTFSEKVAKAREVISNLISQAPVSDAVASLKAALAPLVPDLRNYA
jgi:hypothetical protein